MRSASKIGTSEQSSTEDFSVCGEYWLVARRMVKATVSPEQAPQ